MPVLVLRELIMKLTDPLCSLIFLNPPRRNLRQDCHYVSDLLDCLAVECTPVSVYRMGRREQDRPRIIKVVLPASKFQRLRRAPRLRFSPSHKGVYLRPSLTWEERMHRREQRHVASGELGDNSAMRETQAREACPSPTLSTTPVASRVVSTPFNSAPTGNC